MNSLGHEDISKWASIVDTVIAKTDQCCVDRVVVIESTSSTMDAAEAFAGGSPGLVVIASHQSQGRGQRGRQWLDADRRTLPCTMVIDTKEFTAPMLSAMIACGVHETIKHHAPSSQRVMIKWPNDIVIRDPGRQPSRKIDQKIAGILIERKGDLAHIGIGINCNQGERDWDGALQSKATSLSELGAQVSRLDILCDLIENLSHWLASNNAAEIKAYWSLYDAMVGTRRTFEFDQTRYSGIVEHIDPLDSIHLQTTEGAMILPVAQTRHQRVESSEA